MGRRRRRQEAEDLVQRARALPPEQIGMIMSVLLSNALLSVALEIVLVVTGARAARRAYRVRHRGPRASARTALSRPLIVLACVYGAHRVSSRVLLRRWVRRAVQRAEGDTLRDENQPQTS